MKLALYKLTKGSGTPLIFLHGFLGSSKDWIPVCAALGGHTCIGVDLPGHGDSPFTEHFEEELLEIEPPFHLIGYSMGGRLAMGFAARYPGRVASLFLLSTHTGLPEHQRSERLKSDQKWADLLLQVPIDDFLNRWYDQPIFKTLDREQIRGIPNVIQNLVSDCVGAQNFDQAKPAQKQPPIRNRGRFCGSKGWDANAVGNQILNHVRYRRRKQNVSFLAKALMHYSLGHQPLYDPKGHFFVGEWDTKFRDHYKNRNPIVIAKAGHAIHIERPLEIAHHIKRFL